MRRSSKNINEGLQVSIKDKTGTALEELILSEKQLKIFEAIKSLGDSCQQVLIHFYYDHLSIKEIMRLMNYKSENVTKSKKSQCIKKLKLKLDKNVI